MEKENRDTFEQSIEEIELEDLDEIAGGWCVACGAGAANLPFDPSIIYRPGIRVSSIRRLASLV